MLGTSSIIPRIRNILILSNAKKDGQPTGLQDAGSYFHPDYSFLQMPAAATTLSPRVGPRWAATRCSSTRKRRRPYGPLATLVVLVGLTALPVKL